MDERDLEKKHAKEKAEIEMLLDHPGFQVFRRHLLSLAHSRIEEALGAETSEKQLHALAVARGLLDAMNLMGVRNVELETVLSIESVESRQRLTEDVLRHRLKRSAPQPYNEAVEEERWRNSIMNQRPL